MFSALMGIPQDAPPGVDIRVIEVVLIPVALCVLVVGSSGFFQGALQVPLATAYLIALPCFAAWCLTWDHIFLRMSCALVFAASVVRLVSFGFAVVATGTRLSGVGINILVMLYSVRLSHSQKGEHA